MKINFWFKNNWTAFPVLVLIGFTICFSLILRELVSLSNLNTPSAIIGAMGEVVIATAIWHLIYYDIPESEMRRT